MKKLLCVFLCCILLTSMSVPVFASSNSTNNLQNFYSTPTEFSGIMVSPSGEYAIKSEHAIGYLPVGRLDVNLDNAKSINKLLNEDGISPEVKDYILSLSQQIPKSNGHQMIATVFSPGLVSENSTNPCIYMNYKGMEMKTEQVHLRNISTGYQFVVKGKAAKAAANAVYEIAILIGGIKNVGVSLGSTLLSIFEDAANATVYTSSADDFTQLELTYDDVKQWTYGKYDGVDWYLGYCSEKVIVNHVHEFQQFVTNGVGTQEHTYQSPTDNIRKSSHFDDPWETAYYNLFNPVDEWVTYEIKGTTWRF